MGASSNILYNNSEEAPISRNMPDTLYLYTKK